MHTKAQSTDSDYWQVFEQVSLLQELQSHFPAASIGEVRNHVVMNHGPIIPAFNSDGLTSAFTVSIENKQSLLNSSITEFFLIHESRIESDSAFFDLVYYYDFTGNYEHSVSISAELSKADGAWKITNYTSK